jgi:surface antigen
MAEDKQDKLRQGFKQSGEDLNLRKAQFQRQVKAGVSEAAFQRQRQGIKVSKASFKQAKTELNLTKLAFDGHSKRNPIMTAAKDKKKAAKKVVKQAKRDPRLLRTKAKRGTKQLGKQYALQKTTETLSQDDVLRTGIDLYYKQQQAKTTYFVTKGVVKTGVKAGQKAYGFADRMSNFEQGKGFTRTPQSLQTRTKVRRAIQRQLAAHTKAKKAVAGLNYVRRVAVAATSAKVIGVGALIGVLVLIGVVAAGATVPVSIYQSDQDLTDAWQHMTQTDAKHSDSGNVFYTSLDEPMFYMNYKFEDYAVKDIVNPMTGVIGNYGNYLDRLWGDLNGSAPNYKLTTMADLIQQKGSAYHIDDDDYTDFKEIRDEMGYQVLGDQLEFPIKTDNLVISRRFGYERNGEDITLHNTIDTVVKNGETVTAPMAGVISVPKKDELVITDQAEARVTLRGVDNSRFKGNETVKAKDVLGTMVSDDLNIKYEKYNEDSKAWTVVNPGFYFPKVTYTQFTTLASDDFSPNGDVAKRAQTVYDYLTKLGYTKEGISALLGNFTVESSINPKRAEGDYLKPPVGASGDSWDNETWLAMGGPDIYSGKYPNILHRGLGLGQWTDTSDGGNRHTLLLNYAKSKNKKWYDLELQLDFMLNGDNPGAQSALKNVLSRKAGSTIPELTTYFLNHWEGATDDKLQKRIQEALNWYNYFSNTGGSQQLGESGQKVYDKYKDKMAPLPTNRELKEGYAGNAYMLGNCTWYVYNREAQLGHHIDPYMGNGNQWATNYRKTPGASLTNNPQRGDIVSFTNGAGGTSAAYGHVAVVEYVNDDGSFVISEMNYGGVYQMNWRVLNKQAGMYFIHLSQ